MRLSKITLLVLVCIIVLSVFVAKISNLITIKYDQDPEDFSEKNLENSKKTSHFHKSHHNLVIGDSSEHLMWFIQISDIHVSVFHDPNRINEFRDFCNVTVDTIKPTVVIASGDLADAKEIDNMGSRQFRQEWVYYSEILAQTQVTNKTLWLDIRGNHDNFNVPNINSHVSFYHQFSIQGKRHKRSYMYTIVKGSEKYSFIAVDACLDPGPRRPLNFIGRITTDQYEMLEQFEIDSRGSNATIWFGHYPTSCIISPEPGMRELMKNGVAYLCGHLHTLGGTVPNMYTLQHNGFLELELGDWKENRLFRVAAFDHGLFSFVDVNHGTWPVILVTNPKHALFNLPRKENLHLVINSTHIRILVFSPSPMETVRVKLDNEDWIECKNIKGSPLFVAKWNPRKYANSVHQINVYARDQAGRASEITQPFTLDGSRLHFRLLPRITLMTDATTLFYSVFIILVVVSVAPLLMVRLIQNLVREKRIQFPDPRSIKCCGFVRRIWILCSINKLFYPLIIYPIYLTIGPWFIGEVIDGHLGAAFAWGTYVDGKVLPGAFSYFYGCVQLFWFHLPFVIVLSHCVDLRFRMICLEGKFCSYSSQVWNNLPCAILLFFQAIFAYFFYLAYGTMALFLGPLRTWSVIMGMYLWYFSATLDQRDLIEAKLVWGNRECYNAINNVGNSHEL